MLSRPLDTGLLERSGDLRLALVQVDCETRLWSHYGELVCSVPTKRRACSALFITPHALEAFGLFSAQMCLRSAQS